MCDLRSHFIHLQLIIVCQVYWKRLSSLTTMTDIRPRAALNINKKLHSPTDSGIMGLQFSIPICHLGLCLTCLEILEIVRYCLGLAECRLSALLRRGYPVTGHTEVIPSPTDTICAESEVAGGCKFYKWLLIYQECKLYGISGKVFTGIARNPRNINLGGGVWLFVFSIYFGQWRSSTAINHLTTELGTDRRKGISSFSMESSL